MTAPLADAVAPIAAIAADATGGYCVAFNKTLDMRATPPTYEEHVDCYRRTRGTYARFVSIDPKIFGEHSITGLAIRSNGDLYITALPNMLYRLHAYGQSRPTVRSATLSDSTQYGTDRKVVLDDQTVIVDNNETRSIVGYSVANMNRPLWTIAGVGWPYSGPWGMAVANGMLYVGEKPDRDESMPAGKAAHGVVRYTLRESARPVWSGHISGEDFGFIPQDISVSKNDTLFVGDVGGGDVTVIASAAHNQRLIQRGDSTRTLLGEDLIAFSGKGRLFTSGLDGSIHEYPQNASMGSAPLRTIDGRIQSGSPFVGMAASNDGVVFRSDPTHQSIVVSSAGSSKLRPHVETITGPATQLKKPQGLALDDSGNLYVANEGGDDILVFAARSRGNVQPYKVLGGRFSGMSHPTSLAIAPDKTILVVDDVSTVGLSLSPTSELLRISPSNVRIGSASFPSACHFESL